MRRAPIYLAMFIGGGYLGWTEAQASGYMVRENNAVSVATVFAGDASRADDPSTVFNNPAGMVRLRGSQIEVGAVGVVPDMKFNGSASVFGTPIPGNNSRNVGQSALIPHLFAAFDINEYLKAGIAVTVPFGNTVDYSENWSGRYVGIKTAAEALDINPNVAWRINDRLSIAAGFSLQYFRLSHSNAIPQFLILGPAAPDAIIHFRADDWDFGYNFGILAEPIDGTRVGLTYRSKVDHGLKGWLEFENDSPLLGLVASDARGDLNVPATIGGSVTQEVTPDFSLSAEVQFTQWHTFRQVVVTSVNPTLTLPERYRDSWMVSLGGVYTLSPSWLIRAGGGWDESPVVDGYRDAGVPDKDRYMVGVGFGYRFTPATMLDVGYSHYFAAGHATMNSSFNNTDAFTGAVVLNGRYNNSLNYFALSIRTAM